MDAVKYGFQIIFHPIDCFILIKKNRESFKPLWVVCLLVLAVVIRILFLQLAHFPVTGINITKVNLPLEIATILVPFLSWIVASYAINTIKEGKTKFSESLTGNAYCLVPYIVTTPIFTAFSYLLSSSEAALFSFLQVVVLIWMAVLFFLCLMTANEYSFSRAVVMSVISIIANLIIWAIILLFIVLLYQVFSFVDEIIRESNNLSF